jgi:hypothetical protein
MNRLKKILWCRPSYRAKMWKFCLINTLVPVLKWAEVKIFTSVTAIKQGMHIGYWNMTPCSSVDCCQRFRRTWCFLLHMLWRRKGWFLQKLITIYQTSWHHIMKHHSLIFDCLKFPTAPMSPISSSHSRHVGTVTGVKQWTIVGILQWNIKSHEKSISYISASIYVCRCQ